MKKIAIVNQRYGTEVNGGSEYYTRLIAEHLKHHYDVEILTTTALNYDTWENHYPAGVSTVNGVKVRRFPVKRPRNMLKFRIVSKITRILAKAGVHLDKWWVQSQGPETPELIQYVRDEKDTYDKFIFVTYLYYTTVMGLPEVADKAILIPTAHDEPYIHFPIYKGVFQKSAGMIFLTEEEKSFVQKKFQNAAIPNDVVAVGIDIPQNLQNEEDRVAAVRTFREKYNISGEYIIYAGRVDYGKKCDEMFAFFEKYKELHPEDKIQLVIIGKDMMGIPKHSDIHYLGFVSEEDKYAGIAGAKYLWLPSQFESLSIALLEGMALRVPGIVNGKCEVLKGHCVRSEGAVWYCGYDEYEETMNRLKGMSEEDYEQMRQRAGIYVANNYQWQLVEQKLESMIG